MKIGHGFDIHILKEGIPLVLGNYLVTDSKVGLISNTDGDVVIHSLFDAIVGALGLGDIGFFFPPTTVPYSSSLILDKGRELLIKEGYYIENIDITIIAQTPKLLHHLAHIKQKLAVILKIDEKLVNVKASSTEHLGDIGQSKAIAATSVVLINKGDYLYV